MQPRAQLWGRSVAFFFFLRRTSLCFIDFSTNLIILLELMPV